MKSNSQYSIKLKINKLNKRFIMIYDGVNVNLNTEKEAIELFNKENEKK